MIPTSEFLVFESTCLCFLMFLGRSIFPFVPFPPLPRQREAHRRRGRSVAETPVKRRVAEACDCVCSMRSFWSRLFDPDERVSCFRINLSLFSHVSWPLDISVRSFPSLASATKSSPAPGAERSGDPGVPVKRRVAEACDCVCSMRSFWSRLFDPDERVSCFRINLSLLSHVSWPIDISVRSFPSPASATKSSPAPGAERSGDLGVPVKRRVAEACDCVCSMRSFWSRLFDPDERVSCFRINLSLFSHVSWPLDISVRSFPSPASATKSSPAPGAERSGDPGVPVKWRVAEACDCVCSMRSFWSRLFDPDERVSCFRINLSLLSHVSWPLDISVRSFPSLASATLSSPAPGAERSGDPGVPVKRRVAEACDCVCSMRSFWSRLFDPDERVSCFRINLSLFSHVSWPLDISVRSFPSLASATKSSPAPGAERSGDPGVPVKRRVAEACDCVCSMRSFWSRLFDPDERVSCFRINLSLFSHVSWPLDISVRSFPSPASATTSSPAPGPKRMRRPRCRVQRRVMLFFVEIIKDAIHFGGPLQNCFAMNLLML